MNRCPNGPNAVTRGSDSSALYLSCAAAVRGGAHLNPDAPRVIQRWNGHVWEPHGFAADLAEARRVLFPDTEAARSLGPAPKLGPGTGKHRKPQTPR
jgi:hypothetical protein